MRDLIREILEKEVVTGPEAALILDIHPSAIRQLVMQGKLQSVKKSSGRLYDVQDIKQLLK